MNFTWRGTNGLQGLFRLGYPKVPDCAENFHALDTSCEVCPLNASLQCALEVLWILRVLFFPCDPWSHNRGRSASVTMPEDVQALFFFSKKEFIIMGNEGMELVEWCDSVSELE